MVIDRERVADLGLDLAGVGRELGTLLGGAYVNRFNYFDRSYKVIPQIGTPSGRRSAPCWISRSRLPGVSWCQSPPSLAWRPRRRLARSSASNSETRCGSSVG